MKPLGLVLMLLLMASSGDAQQRSIADPDAKNGAVIGRIEGKDVHGFVLKNRGGMVVTLTDFGATVTGIWIRDRQGLTDVVLGYDTLEGYQSKEDPYFGAVVGRYANRIAKGRFKLEGREYTLATNNGPNSLHGGNRGFDKRLWDLKDSGTDHVTLHYLSPDGEEGYPGNLDVTVKYTLTDTDELKIDYTATTDKATVLNLSNHSYFDLAGQGNGNVLKHQVTIAADKITPVDSTLIPTGGLKPVEGTPFDFRKPHAIGERIHDKDQQLEYGKGYDHNFVISAPAGKVRMAAKVTDPASGRSVEVLTDQPGLQFYTGNFLDGTIKGKGGRAYPFRGAFCLETQHFPDSPNHPNFPTTKLKPEERFQSTTIYRFSSAK